MLEAASDVAGLPVQAALEEHREIRSDAVPHVGHEKVDAVEAAQ
jgi:hypothetical protein